MWHDVIALADGWMKAWTVDRGVNLSKEKRISFAFFLSSFYPFASKPNQANNFLLHLETFSLYCIFIVHLCPSSSVRVDQNNIGAYVPVRFNVQTFLNPPKAFSDVDLHLSKQLIIA